MTDVADRHCALASMAELNRFMVAVQMMASSHGPTRTTKPTDQRETCESWHNYKVAIDRHVGRRAPGQGQVKR